MFDTDSLIGLETQKAIEILKANGFFNISIKLNSKQNEKAKTKLVTAVKLIDDEVVLYCGEFCLDF